MGGDAVGSGMNRILVSVLVAGLTPVLGGCVFWEIRDGVRDTNARLDTVDASLGNTNQRLDSTNAELTQLRAQLAALETTNAELENVQSDLGRLDTTNTSLSAMEARLEQLNAIQRSLASLDVHLASLRKTLGRIDGMIPFLDLGTDSEVEPAAGDAAPSAEVAAAPEVAPAPETARPTRDASLGVWLRQYPDRRVALVFLEGNRYILQRQSDGEARVETGTWARAGKSMTLTPDAPSPAPAAAVSTPAGGAATAPVAAPPPPGPMAFEIASQTTRSLTLRRDGEGLWVFSRP